MIRTHTLKELEAMTAEQLSKLEASIRARLAQPDCADLEFQLLYKQLSLILFVRRGRTTSCEPSL